MATGEKDNHNGRNERMKERENIAFNKKNNLNNKVVLRLFLIFI